MHMNYAYIIMNAQVILTIREALALALMKARLSPTIQTDGGFGKG